MPPSSRRTYAVLLGATGGLDAEAGSDIALLDAIDAVDEIHVWVSNQDVKPIRELVSANSWEKVAAVQSGQGTRDAVIFDALTAIRPTAGDEDIVLIADVERGSLTESTASSCLLVAADQGAAILGSKVQGDVILADHAGKLAGQPREGGTFLAAGLLVTQFGPMFDLYDWASTVAKGSIDSPYRWSLSQLKAVVVPTDGREG
jgi:hypothetical protein